MSTASTQHRWDVREAEMRFGELVRRARDEGPQHVGAPGHDEVVVVSAEAFQRMVGANAASTNRAGTGKLIVDAMRASPHKDIDLEPPRGPMPVRDVAL